LDGHELGQRVNKLKTSKISGIVLFLLISSVCILLPGTWAPAKSAQEPIYGGRIVVSILGDPPHLIPTLTLNVQTDSAADPIFNALVGQDLNSAYIPDLAESWEISSDGLTYVFHLANATWHDGVAVTSEDVKFTILEVYKYHSYGKTLLSALEEIQTAGPQTVILRFNVSQPAAVMASLVRCQILPKHLYENTNVLENEYNMKPIGSGPFKFKEWVKGDHITLTRNANYFKKDLPYVDEIVYKIIPTAEGAALAFDKGEVDVIPYMSVPMSEVERWGADPNAKVVLGAAEAGDVIMMLTFNLEKTELPTSNILVREAIYHALNLSEILSKAWYGVGNIGTSAVSTDWAKLYNPNLPQYEHNVTRANELLDLAGYPKGSDGNRFSLKMVYRPPLSIQKSGELMKEQLKAVGINLDLIYLEIAAAATKVYVSRDFELYLGHFATGPNPDVGVSRLYCAWNIRPGVTYTNAAFYNNSRVDELFALAKEATNETQRIEYYYEVQQILATDLPTIWLTEELQPIVFKARLNNITALKWSPDRSFAYAWWTAAEAETQPFPWIYVAVAAVAIVVLGVVGAFYVKRRKVQAK
jgi:peptide/nickel transport system substrate-binding protein